MRHTERGAPSSLGGLAAAMSRHRKILALSVSRIVVAALLIGGLRFQSALPAHDNVACHLLPRLDHQFISGVGRSTPAEYEVAGHVDVEAIELIPAFVLAN
jgi:hypothetical protein